MMKVIPKTRYMRSKFDIYVFIIFTGSVVAVIVGS